MSVTPECPGCGAKFQHDNQQCVCKRCGLPDAVIHAGTEEVGRWIQRAARRGVPAALDAVSGRKARGGSLSRRSKAHGRRGGAKKLSR